MIRSNEQARTLRRGPNNAGSVYIIIDSIRDLLNREGNGWSAHHGEMVVCIPKHTRYEVQLESVSND